MHVCRYSKMVTERETYLLLRLGFRQSERVEDWLVLEEGC